MKDRLSKKRLGFVVGIFLATIHLIWALVVMVGGGQYALDFAFAMHMLSVPIYVTEFSFLTSILLIIMTFVCGYIGGWLFAAIWNSVREK